MKPKKDKKHARCVFRGTWFLWMSILLCCIAQDAYAQAPHPKKAPLPAKAGRYSSLPSGYNQVGTTQLYYRQTTDAIDVIGRYNGYYYSSTYGDYGYKLSVKVGSNSAMRVNCLSGTTSYGMTVQPSIIQQGEFARMVYTVTNNNSTDVIISMGVHADVMIGNNDAAPISRRIDTVNQTYGLTMKDGNGAQLCVLFGSGLAGVTSVNDFWFGHWSDNSAPENMVGNYYVAGNWMKENGSYDSGMGWCWKNRTIPAGNTVVFSYLIGVGEVNLEPNSSFEVTPDDPDGWNDLSLLHRLTLTGTYESPAGLEGVIDYAVEDSEEWTALTGTLASGDEFEGTVLAMFDPLRPVHTIRFRTRDLVGNTTMLQPIEYIDVSFHALSGIEDKTYTGEELLQTNATCDLEDEHYVLKNYQNNVNAGVASFNHEGVFPYTIGRKTYTFNILPQPLSGQLSLSSNYFVYNGYSFTPGWQFTNTAYANLQQGTDYTLAWTNNRLPGTGRLTVTGQNNYAGSLFTEFTIDKAPLTNDLYSQTLPNEDITYDGNAHAATVTKAEGVGTATISYQKQGAAELTSLAPTEAGTYAVYLEFADGTLYYGRARTQIGSFTIYEFNAEEWAVLQTLLPRLKGMGWQHNYDASLGIKSVGSLPGFTINQGHVTALALNSEGLSGSFPTDMLKLPQLASINMSGNHLTGDLSTLVAAFAQANPGAGAGIRVLNISNNSLSGNLGILSACLPSLQALNASDNCFEEVYPAIPSTVTSLNIARQTINRVVPLQLSNLTPESIATLVPSILLYDHQNQTYTSDIRLLCATPDEEWAVRLTYLNGQFGLLLASAQNAYRGENGGMLVAHLLNNSNVREGSTFPVQFGFDEGDANIDGNVNVLDLQTDILYIMEKYFDRPYNFTAANLWQDTQINVQDVIKLVDKLMTTENSQNADARLKMPSAESESSATIGVVNRQLVVNSERPVAAFDIIVAGTANMSIAASLAQMGMTVSMKPMIDGLHIIGYAMNGACIPAGRTVIGTFDASGASVHNIMLSDNEAHAISVTKEGTTTGIENVTTPDYEHHDVFDLQGRKVNGTMKKGLYIKDGRKVMK